MAAWRPGDSTTMIERRLGPYYILAKLGEGGMGEVYRARDTKLNRDVALKILPEAFSADPDRLMRFSREAQTLAALNHPNIATIYGIEESEVGGQVTRALAMELVEGDDLSARIAHGPIPFDECRAIARQIADALEAAHDAGIVHRDLKPANIKVRADGTVKVLDFGLAKALDPGAGGTGISGPGARVDPHNSPTMTSPAMTAMGLILGTAAYMSPEQAKGRAVDRRADIWAFGVVLYEMLTGRQAFTGDDVSDLLVSVLRDAPDFSALPETTPASVRRLLRRCLEKDPRKRLSAIGDARLELDEADETPAAPAVDRPAATGRSRLIAGVLLVAGLAAAVTWFARPAQDLPLRLMELPASMAESSGVVLSPDGTRVAYSLGGRIFVRRLDTLAAVDLGPTGERLDTLFWSPDSQTIGFVAESEIRTIPASGGPLFVVGKVPATGRVIQGSWLDDGTIVFAAWRENVYGIPAVGGTAALEVPLDPATEIDVHNISEAPDDRLILGIHQRSDRNSIVLARRHGTEAGQDRVVLTDDQNIGSMTYVGSNRVIFTRGRVNAGLWTAPFEEGRLDLRRASLLQAGGQAPSVANNGSLTFVMPAASRSTFVWVDRAGVATSIPGVPLELGAGFAISPDGNRAVFPAGPGNQEDLVVRDLNSGVDTQITFRKTGGLGAEVEASDIRDPAWFPSGDDVLFSSGAIEDGRLFAKPSEAAAQTRELVAGLTNGQITRDSRQLAGLRDERGLFRLMSAPFSADGTVGPVTPVFPTDAPVVREFSISPDGSLVVFTGTLADNQRAVFLSEFPVSTHQWLVDESASAPRFSPDGREVFYIRDETGPDGPSSPAMTSRYLATTSPVTFGPATTLFTLADTRTADGTSMVQEDYDVAPDGRRFLFRTTVAPNPGEGRRFMWVQNWPALLKK